MLRDWTFTFTNIQLSGLSTISYVFDFLFYSTVLILSATLGRTLPPRYHEFLLYDISLRFTYFPENAITIPIWLLVLISAGLPLLQFLAFSLLLPCPSSDACGISLLAVCVCWGNGYPVTCYCAIEKHYRITATRLY